MVQGGIPRIEARVPDLPRVVYESEEEEEEKEAGGAEKTDEKQVVLMPPVCAEVRWRLDLHGVAHTQCTIRERRMKLGTPPILRQRS